MRHLSALRTQGGKVSPLWLSLWPGDTHVIPVFTWRRQKFQAICSYLMSLRLGWAKYDPGSAVVTTPTVVIDVHFQVPMLYVSLSWGPVILLEDQ